MSGVYINMVNLLIGIVGGIFSSIIVSRVFLIATEYQGQLVKNRDRFESLYGIQVLFLVKIKKQPPAKKDDYYKMLNTCFDNAQSRFSDYYPKDYKFSLHAVLVKAYTFVCDYSMTDFSNIKVMKKASNELEKILNDFEACERNYIKGCIQRLLHDIILIILFSILVIIVVAVIILAIVIAKSTT